MKSIIEYIADVESDSYLYPEQLGKVYRKLGIMFDTRDKDILANLALASKLRKEGVSKKDILAKMIPLKLRFNSQFYCKDEEFGIGHVTQLFKSGNMFVKFKERRLPTMCDSKSTIHDEKKRKIKHIA